jgi:hypothetical protein
MVDSYTKAVLTVIAGSLVIIATQNLSARADAQGSGHCGSSAIPCYVTSSVQRPVEVDAADVAGLEVKINENAGSFKVH